MTIQGKSVYSGVAIGRLAIYQISENQVMTAITWNTDWKKAVMKIH